MPISDHEQAKLTVPISHDETNQETYLQIVT